MEQEEFLNLIQTDGAAVYGFCVKLAENRMEADDLYQDTFLKAYEKRRQIDRFSNPRSFLMSIAVGLWKNRRRKFARRNRIALACAGTGEGSGMDAGGFGRGEAQDIEAVRDDGLLPEEELIRKEECQMLRRVVKELPEHLRLPLYLHYGAGSSVDEIAGILHIPAGTVKSRMFRAKNRLRKELEERGYEV